MLLSLLKKNHVLQVNNSIYTLYNVCQLRLLSLIFCHFIWFHPTKQYQYYRHRTQNLIYTVNHTHIHQTNNSKLRWCSTSTQLTLLTLKKYQRTDIITLPLLFRSANLHLQDIVLYLLVKYVH